MKSNIESIIPGNLLGNRREKENDETETRKLDKNEKKVCDELSHKEWSFRTFEKVAGIADRDGRADRIIAIASLVATIVGFGIAWIQIHQANVSYRESVEQFNLSGPRYSWFDARIGVHALATSTDEGSSARDMSAIVVSNTGRTQDTIVAIRRNGNIDDTAATCIPTFDEEGNLDEDAPVSVGTGLTPLEPGDSRLVFIVPKSPGTLAQDGRTRKYSSDATRRLDMLAASGLTYESERLDDVAEEIQDYYMGLPGILDAAFACETAFEKTFETGD